MYIHQFGKVFQVYPSSLVSLQKTLSTARNGIFFGPMFIAIGLLLSRTRRLPKKVSLIGFLISFVLFFAEVSLYRHFGILRDLTSMYICLIPAIYFLVNYLLKSIFHTVKCLRFYVMIH